ncbi:MAG: N-acetylmuramoyl-L-alanine amidase [Ruminococcaceae bacterium]|nr:N-acetylmuramoyl-L-alanine amidase [Oscillospiraceae bacterium]
MERLIFMTKIFVDAGHGGPDPGAVGNGVTEEYVNLNVARYLAQDLRNAGYDVMEYRTTPTENVLSDKNADLRNRASMANSWGADYFISIHTNSSTNPSAQGAEAYVYRLGGEAERLGESILESISDRLGSINRGVMAANFAVLRRTRMPAVLVELGYLTNPTEALNLNSPAWQRAVAEAIAVGIISEIGPSI